MKGIEEICKHNKKWQSISLSICKDKTEADEVLQLVYLRLMNITKEIDDFYVIMSIRNMFYDRKKNKKSKLLVFEMNMANFEREDSIHELTHEEQEIVNIAKEYLTFWELELLDMSSEHSLRQLQERYKIHYKAIFDIIKKSKKTIWQKVKEKNTNQVGLAIQ